MRPEIARLALQREWPLDLEEDWKAWDALRPGPSSRMAPAYAAWHSAVGNEIKVGDHVHVPNHIGEESGVHGQAVRRSMRRGVSMIHVKLPSGSTKAVAAGELEHMSSAEQAEHERASLATAAGRTAMHMAAASPAADLEESKQTAALSVTHAPIGKGGTNWVTASKPGNTGQLPAYIQNIRNAIMRGGKPESEATGDAISAAKRWASGGGGVSAEVKAAAAKAVAEFEAMRAAAHVKSGAKDAAKKVA